MEPLLRSSLMGWVLRASSRSRRGAGPDGGGGGVGTGERRPNNRIVTERSAGAQRSPELTVGHH